MNVTRRTTVGIAAAIAIAPLGLTPAATATPFEDYFVVNTQDLPSSPIVEAGGAFTGCTSVTDLGVIGEQVGPQKVMFIGDKRVHCANGYVDIHYNATLNFSSGKRTSGHWFVDASTVPGISDGFGTVRGDNTRCTPIAPSEFCILDTFAGDVF